MRKIFQSNRCSCFLIIVDCDNILIRGGGASSPWRQLPFYYSLVNNKIRSVAYPTSWLIDPALRIDHVKTDCPFIFKESRLYEVRYLTTNSRSAVDFIATKAAEKKLWTLMNSLSCPEFVKGTSHGLCSIFLNGELTSASPAHFWRPMLKSLDHWSFFSLQTVNDGHLKLCFCTIVTCGLLHFMATLRQAGCQYFSRSDLEKYCSFFDTNYTSIPFQ